MKYEGASFQINRNLVSLCRHEELVEWKHASLWQLKVWPWIF